MTKIIITLLIVFALFNSISAKAEEENLNPEIENQIKLLIIKKWVLRNIKKDTPATNANTQTVTSNSDFDNRIKVTDNNKADLIERTKKYFKTYFPKSPVKPEYLVNLSQEKDFPLDFILLNGHLESHMCTAGRGATSKNCHNVNNTDAGDYKPTVCGQYTQCNSKYEIGEVQFIELIKNCYMNKGETITLQSWLDRDFRVVRTVKPFCSAAPGARYMTDKKSLYKYEFGIENWINPIFAGYPKI
jgi:hypothetical protein